MSAHTPGPWSHSYRERTHGMWAEEIYDATGRTVAVAAWYEVPSGPNVLSTNREANACLIAAAPDLLEALRAVVPWVVTAMAHREDPHPDAVRNHKEDMDLMFAAIAKAEGKA